MYALLKSSSYEQVESYTALSEAAGMKAATAECEQVVPRARRSVWCLIVLTPNAIVIN